MDDGLTTPKHRKNYVKLLKIHFACNPLKLGFSANNHLSTTHSSDLHIGVEIGQLVALLKDLLFLPEPFARPSTLCQMLHHDQDNGTS